MEGESSTSKRPIEEQEQLFLAFVQQHHAALAKWFVFLHLFIKMYNCNQNQQAKKFLKRVHFLAIIDQLSYY
jgi:hypothetical protein